MALFLPPSIVIDVWLLFEPPCDAPADAAEAAAGPAGNAPAAASETASDPDTDSLYDGYHLVPAYFWHREDNGFSMPWQHLVDTQLESEDHAPAPKRHPALARPAPDGLPEPPESAD